jgi:hypothetical protein
VRKRKGWEGRGGREERRGRGGSEKDELLEPEVEFCKRS